MKYLGIGFVLMFCCTTWAAGFRLESTDIQEGKPLPSPQMSGIFGAGGQDCSPELAWKDAPKGTQSFALTVYDPDAPTGSGFWHWAIYDIPSNTTQLPRCAGEEKNPMIPPGSVQIPNDAAIARYLGAAPPKGHGKHRYIFTIYAVDVAHLGLGAQATPALLGFYLHSHTLAKASITAWAETK